MHSGSEMSAASAGPAPGVIVVGMHRSSTSLVASAFASCGYRVADEMLKARPDNPKGYFEDAEVHFLHRRMLEAYDTAWDLSPRLRRLRARPDLPMPTHLAERADAAVDYYRSDGPWVWKNPRTTLFMQEWGRRFPEARFVLCVRAPGEVVDSMMRRGDRMRISARRPLYRTRRLFRGLSVWYSYNLIAWRYAKQFPDRVVVVRIPEDIPVLARSADVYEPSLLRKGRAQVRLPALLALRTRWLYVRLCRLADPVRLEDLLLHSVTDADRV